MTGLPVSVFLAAKGSDNVCGRYTLVQWEELSVRFGLSVAIPLKARYNIAPTQCVPVVVREQRQNVLALYRWGLVPHWSKEPGYPLINARAETVHEKNSFRESFRDRRCVIPADGFFEWQKAGKNKKPYRFALKTGELFTFAGLWDIWTPPNGKPLFSCTIITTEANSLVSPIHNRMPVILDKKGETLWLDPSVKTENLKRLLIPYSPENMERSEVSALVNSPKNDSPEILMPETSKYPVL